MNIKCDEDQKMSKYTPLQNFLMTLPRSQRDITLTFDRIEQIIIDKLPYSAFHHRAWWSNERNGRHVEAHSWLNAGWQVETVNQEQKWVRFIRS